MDAITPMSHQPHKSMDTGALKKFAQEARRTLRDQVSGKLVQVLAENSSARREAPKAVQQLESEIARTSRDQVIERVAYIWFNRITALRFMDANGYTAVRVVTPADGQTRPEILSEAMAGVIGDEIPEVAAAQIRALLDNRTPSRDAQGEAYRRLLVATCNYWHAAMPFMFETIADYTELLMPEDLLSQGSIVAKMRAVMTDDACEDVEIIGWLYQFYISEKKDEVFAGLKKNKKITPENIPAATQLFTPHWIVRYLVENSLGRLWMLNRPKSRLVDRMNYYIPPQDQEPDYLRISSPDEIKICDPACGSGHMLTYAFDLLHAIYEEEGYDVAEIPGLILTHNLYGIEIDDRAGALAAFALTMKAAACRKRFLRRGVQPNVCVLEPVRFEGGELNDYMEAMGRDFFTVPISQTLNQFDQVDNFGSLIRPALTDVDSAILMVEGRDVGGNLFLRDVHSRVCTALRMARYLSPQYHVVIGNPPYKNRSDLNETLSKWIDNSFPASKADLYTAFIERCIERAQPRGQIALVTMQSWMFIDTLKDLRERILSQMSIRNLVQIGFNSFPEMNSKVALAVAFVMHRAKEQSPGLYLNLNDAPQSSDKGRVFLQRKDEPARFMRPKAADMLALPTRPIAYEFTEGMFEVYKRGELISDYLFSDGLTKTGDNETYLRFFWEPSLSKAKNLDEYRCCAKGGASRNYYGNVDVLVSWSESDRRHYQADHVARISPSYLWDRAGITWTKISTKSSSFRVLEPGTIAETGGPTLFLRDEAPHGGLDSALGLLSSKVSKKILSILCPTVNFQTNDILNLPFPHSDASISRAPVQHLVRIHKEDWSASETSSDFQSLELLSPKRRYGALPETYGGLREYWKSMVADAQRFEEENNRIFIDAFGLQAELAAQVPVGEVTLTCNPAYRYGGKKSDAELDALLRADTMRDFVSYSVGCMFGRFSLDAPGLILANPGDGLDEFLAKVSRPTFEPDVDNVIPVLDGEWFADDIAARFRRFLRATFGEENFQENLAFVEEGLGKDIRKYFIRDFFNDHVKRYKKRPIYWLFSSPKGTFNALIYLHRYRPDTVSVVLNDYLREFRSKLEAHRRGQESLSISGDASPAQRTKALKEIEATGKQIDELDAWERDVLFPLATQKIEIDLDHGVKANYPKFGAALKPIKGLNDADD